MLPLVLARTFTATGRASDNTSPAQMPTAQIFDMLHAKSSDYDVSSLGCKEQANSPGSHNFLLHGAGSDSFR